MSLPFRLRAATQAGYRVRGAARICEWIRRFYLRWPFRVWIDDFDGDLWLEVDLSEHMGSQVFWRGSYSTNQLALLRRLLRPEHVFFDVGANFGEFTLFAAKRLTHGRIFAFEPVREFCLRLEGNLARNAIKNVRTFNAGLSDHAGPADIWIPTGRVEDGSRNDGLPSLYGGHGRRETIQLETLDGVVARERPSRIDLIKFDVEGAELPALRGGEVALRRFRPVVIVEVNERTCRNAGYDQSDILNFLRALGYRLNLIDASGDLAPLERLTDFQNIVAVPG